MMRTRSDIEFIISGPLGGRDRVLIQSDNADLTLLGLVAGPKLSRKRSSDLDASVAFGAFSLPAPVHIVDSSAEPDLKPAVDKRTSQYRFVWRGFATSSDVNRIEQHFRLRAPLLAAAINYEDQATAEWVIAPLLAECSLAHQRRQVRRRMILTFVAIYSGSVVVYLIFMIIRLLRGETGL